MNIAVLSHAHYAIRQPFIGGLEAHTHQLVAELVSQGNQVTIFAKAGTVTAGRLVTIFRGDAEDGDNPNYDRGFHKAMRLIGHGSYDLIFNNSLNYVPLALHTADMPPMITVFHTPPRPKMIAVLDQFATVANRTYIAVSEFTAAQWQPYCGNQVSVVANGMNLASWKTNLSGPARPTAAWVGRITPEKGTHVAIEACLLAGLPLRFGGPIYDRAYYQKRIKPLLASPLISYAGHLDHRGVNDLFAAASVALVTPLWDEPFGLVEIEAWASGTPVAALPNGALPSLMRDDVGSLSKSDSAADLAIALQRAMKADRAVCRYYAEANFSLATMVESYLELIPEGASEEEDLSLVWQPIV